MPIQGVEERFETKVVLSAGCRLWQGATRDGYPLFWDPVTRKLMPALRWAYIKWRREITSDVPLRRICENRLCVDQQHAEEQCSNGHPWRKESIYTSPKGVKRCRICKLLRERKK